VSHDEHTEQHNKRVYIPPIDDTASEDPDESGGPNEEPTAGVEDAKTHRSTHQDSEMTSMTAHDGRDEDTTTTMLHMKLSSSSIPLPRDHYTTQVNAAGSYPDASSMEATCPPTTENFEHMCASVPCVNTTTLLDEDVHLKEMMVAQLDLLQQQAAMDRKDTQEELFELKNRIKWLEDRALGQQVGPREPTEETLSTTISSQRHHSVFFQPLRQDHNNNMIPSQQNIWEMWNRSQQQTTPSENDDIQHDPHAHENTVSRHGGVRWDQLDRIYTNFHDNGNNTENNTPTMSDDEDDIAAILDLPPEKSKGENSMEAGSEMTTVMDQIVTTSNMQGPHISGKEKDISARGELLTNNTHFFINWHFLFLKDKED
jgi:hypothetical protein